MKQAEISVLNGLYKNAAVGKDAILSVFQNTLKMLTSEKNFAPSWTTTKPSSKKSGSR